MEGAGSARYSVKLMKALGEMAVQPPEFWDSAGTAVPWADLPITRRAQFVLASVQYIMNSRDGDEDDFAFCGMVEGLKCLLMR